MFYLFSFYIFDTVHFTNVVLKESLGLFLHDRIWKACNWTFSFVSGIWI